MCNISVVMPAFNAEKYIQEAIDSILAQTYRNFELIIINDGSSDSTSTIIESYNDDRIIYIKNKKNLGIVASRNKGLSCSKGKYIACMDSDDIALPSRLEMQYNFMEKNLDIGFCGGQAISFGNGRKDKPMLTSSLSYYDLAFDLCLKCPFIHPTIFFRKEILIKYNLSYENTSTEDYQLYARLLKYTKFINLPDILIYYRRHSSQFTVQEENVNNSKNVGRVQASVIEAYNSLFNINIIPEAFLKQKPTKDSIKSLSQQFREISNLFSSLPVTVLTDVRLGKEFLKYCLNWKGKRFTRFSLMCQYLPVGFRFCLISYYIKNFFIKSN